MCKLVLVKVEDDDLAPSEHGIFKTFGEPKSDPPSSNPEKFTYTGVGRLAQSKPRAENRPDELADAIV